jgi:branched-chain amino acid transport system substrate-binding protein
MIALPLLADADETVVIVRGKSPSAMKNKEDFWEVVEVVPGEPLMQKSDAFGCKLGDYN